MTNHPEPTQRHDPFFRVHVDAFVDWLATSTDSRGNLFADIYAVHDNDTFRRSGEAIDERVQMLVDQAQRDGILTSDDHHAQLWQVADEGFLLTLDGPTPPRLCSLHVGVNDLMPDKTSGSVAALAVLMSVAQIANQILTEDQRTRATVAGPATFPSIRRGTPVDPPPTSTNARPTIRRPHHGR